MKLRKTVELKQEFTAQIEITMDSTLLSDIFINMWLQRSGKKQAIMHIKVTTVVQDKGIFLK